MPLFRYKAITEAGRVIESQIEAANAVSVADQLDALNYTPVRINEIGSSFLNLSLLESKPKIKTDEIIVFTKQMVTLLKAGVPLLSSLEALSDQTENESLKTVIGEIYGDVEGGASFSDALAKHPRVFSELYVNTISAGEAGGAMDEVMSRLALLMHHERETRNRIKSAMRYPLIIIVSLILAITALIVLVVPNFVNMFNKSGIELPLPTRVLIGFNNLIQAGWYYILGGVLVGGVAFMRYIKTERGRFQWDAFKLQMPILGNLTLKTSMSRFSRMFETLNRSGMPILQTLDTVARTVGNEVVAGEIGKAALGIQRGEGLAQPLRESSLFPPMVVRMISIGEQSGSLDEMLQNISEHYDMEVDYAVKGLTSMIEPMLTVVLGAVVLFLALAIFLPMWDLTQLAK